MELYKNYITEKYSAGMLSGVSIQCPENFNFGYDVVDYLGSADPDKRAMVWCDETGRHLDFTFSQLSRLSNQAANVIASHDIKKGDRVMVILKRHYEYWYVLPALHKLGAIAIPATHLLKTDDINERVDAVGIKAIIVTADDPVINCMSSKTCDVMFSVRGNRKGFVDFSAEMLTASESFPRIDTKVHEPMLLYFTSGTTGTPKAVVHDYKYSLAHIVTAKYWQQVVNNGLHLSVSDTGWGKASWGKIYGQWLCGSAVMVYDYDQFNPSIMADIIKKYGVTTFCAPPTIYRYLNRARIPSDSFASVQHVTTAGEAFDVDVIEKFKEKTGLTIHEGYGQTESVLLLGNLFGSTPRAGSMGKPSPLYHVEIMRPDGSFADEGEQGEIVIIPDESEKPAGIFTGYYGDSKTYDYAWRGGVYHTNDISYRDSDGYYWYISRCDDIIKSRGYRISPMEIEHVLSQHPAVLECAVTGKADKGRGFSIKATVVLNSAYTAGDELAVELREYMLEHTASYKCPKIFEFVHELPRTISGKVQRAVLRT